MPTILGHAWSGVWELRIKVPKKPLQLKKWGLVVMKGHTCSKKATAFEGPWATLGPNRALLTPVPPIPPPYKSGADADYDKGLERPGNPWCLSFWSLLSHQ